MVIAITSPAISAASIQQDESVAITATISGADYAMVLFISTAGDSVYAIPMTITGTAATSSTFPNRLPVDTYGVGQVQIWAVDTHGVSEYDASLALTVTALTGMTAGTQTWLRQTITLKPYSTVNSYGEVSYGAAVSVYARIIQKTQKIIDDRGREVLSHTEIIVPGDTTVGVNSHITLPDTTTPQILVVEEINAANADVTHYKVIYT